MPEKERVIFTIGHSTLQQESFIALLHKYGVRQVADIRRFPGSRRFPHFNKVNLENVLPCFGVMYQHWPGLGGRRSPQPVTAHPEWKNASFRAFADYTDTAEFKHQLAELEDKALQEPTVIMCSEALWWRCHRSLIADALKELNWTVLHIFSDSNAEAEEHPYTRPWLERNQRME